MFAYIFTAGRLILPLLGLRSIYLRANDLAHNRHSFITNPRVWKYLHLQNSLRLFGLLIQKNFLATLNWLEKRFLPKTKKSWQYRIFKTRRPCLSLGNASLNWILLNAMKKIGFDLGIMTILGPVLYNSLQHLYVASCYACHCQSLTPWSNIFGCYEPKGLSWHSIVRLGCWPCL